MTNEIAVIDNHKQIDIFSVDNLDHYMRIAGILSKTTLIPKNYIGKPDDILVAMQMGMALGLPMMQAVQGIAVINGKPSLYGDSLLAVVQGHKDYEWMKEEPILDKNQIIGYLCTVKRKNSEPHPAPFTIDDAKKANLWGKAGPWSQYPSRMLQMRARSFALRDTFADALLGIQSAEECEDIIDVTPKTKTTAKNAIADLMSSKEKSNVYQETINGNPVIEMDSNPSRIQLVERVEELLIATEFQPERLQKALIHYKATDIEQMSREQLNDFIVQLNKELFKMAEIEEGINDIDPETGEVIQ